MLHQNNVGGKADLFDEVDVGGGSDVADVEIVDAEFEDDCVRGVEDRRHCLK